MKLSILDLSPVRRNMTRAAAIKNTVATAQTAEELGFHRIWLAEHHNAATIAGNTPEALIPLVASNTSSIRVGSGAVLLNHYSPFKVAEIFATLESMFPGRIDMGIGRATTGPYSDLALQKDRSRRHHTDDSFEQLTELLTWMNGDFETGHPFRTVKVLNDGTFPSFWLLGSSAWSGNAAAQLGLQYSFAGHINPTQAFDITRAYKSRFKPAEALPGVKTPKLNLGLTVYCGETEKEAAIMSAPFKLVMARMMQGDMNSPVETEEDAVRILGAIPAVEKMTDPTSPPRTLTGTPETIRKDLEAIRKAFGADEMIIQCMSANHELRMRSFRLLSEEMGLLV